MGLSWELLAVLGYWAVGVSVALAYLAWGALEDKESERLTGAGLFMVLWPVGAFLLPFVGLYELGARPARKLSESLVEPVLQRVRRLPEVVERARKSKALAKARTVPRQEVG